MRILIAKNKIWQNAKMSFPDYRDITICLKSQES